MVAESSELTEATLALALSTCGIDQPTLVVGKALEVRARGILTSLDLAGRPTGAMYGACRLAVRDDCDPGAWEIF